MTPSNMPVLSFVEWFCVSSKGFMFRRKVSWFRHMVHPVEFILDQTHQFAHAHVKRSGDAPECFHVGVLATMDECWADITPLCKSFDTAAEIADEIRLAIKEELGLTVSIGVSFSKVLAKLGSDMKKPDAVTLLAPSNWRERVWPLPVSDLLYIGSRTTRKLVGRGIVTICHYPKQERSRNP